MPVGGLQEMLVHKGHNQKVKAAVQANQAECTASLTATAPSCRPPCAATPGTGYLLGRAPPSRCCQEAVSEEKKYGTGLGTPSDITDSFFNAESEQF